MPGLRQKAETARAETATPIIEADLIMFLTLLAEHLSIRILNEPWVSIREPYQCARLGMTRSCLPPIENLDSAQTRELQYHHSLSSALAT